MRRKRAKGTDGVEEDQRAAAVLTAERVQKRFLLVGAREMHAAER